MTRDAAETLEEMAIALESELAWPGDSPEVREMSLVVIKAALSRVVEMACKAVCRACAGRWGFLAPEPTFELSTGGWWHSHKTSGDPIESGAPCTADEIRRAFAPTEASEAEAAEAEKEQG